MSQFRTWFFLISLVSLTTDSSAGDAVINQLQVEIGRRIALIILQEAIQKYPEKDFYPMLFESLNGATLHWVNNQDLDFRECGTSVIAFVPAGDDSNIYLCKRIFNLRDARAFGQILIHETVHLTGIENEYLTTLLEVRVMLDSQGRIAYVNGYLQDLLGL